MLKPRPIWCPNVLLLDSGNAQFFPIDEAKEIVKKLTKDTKLITVYISHNFPEIDESQIVVKSFDYAIYREKRCEGNSLATQILNAGSSYVYYIQTFEDSYRAAFIHIFDILGMELPIICISNSLANQLQCAAIVFPNNRSKGSFLTKKTFIPDNLLMSTYHMLKTKVVFHDTSLVLSIQ